MASIYNTTDGPLAIDRAGRQLAARERREVDTVDGSPLAGHIAAGRVLVLDETPAEETTAQPAKRGRRTDDTQEA